MDKRKLGDTDASGNESKLCISEYCYVIDKAKYLQGPEGVWLSGAEIVHGSKPLL